MVGKRRCGNCNFFSAGPTPCAGHCRHPERQSETDVVILHRENELRCRSDWWHDLWEPGSDDDWLLAIRMRGPIEPDEGRGGSGMPLLQRLMVGSAPAPARTTADDAEAEAGAGVWGPEVEDAGCADGDEMAAEAAGQEDREWTRVEPARQTTVHVCGTCRDFAPDAEGHGGWCRNLWAFSRRTRVEAEVLACQGLLGCWWLPHDELWLASGDASRHDEPTPLVDLLVRRLEP